MFPVPPPLPSGPAGSSHSPSQPLVSLPCSNTLTNRSARPASCSAVVGDGISRSPATNERSLAPSLPAAKRAGARTFEAQQGRFAQQLRQSARFGTRQTGRQPFSLAQFHHTVPVMEAPSWRPRHKGQACTGPRRNRSALGQGESLQQLHPFLGGGAAVEGMEMQAIAPSATHQSRPPRAIAFGDSW